MCSRCQQAQESELAPKNHLLAKLPSCSPEESSKLAPKPSSGTLVGYLRTRAYSLSEKKAVTCNKAEKGKKTKNKNATFSVWFSTKMYLSAIK